MTDAKRASIRDLLAQVHASVNQQREDKEEWMRLEQENLDLRLELQAHINTKHHYQQSNLLSSPSSLDVHAEDSVFRTLGEQELLLLRTTSFLASSSALLRTQLDVMWDEHRNIGVAIGLEHKSDASAAASAGAVAATATPATPAPSPSARNELCELSWILQTLPRCTPPPAVATPLPIISDSPRASITSPTQTPKPAQVPSLPPPPPAPRVLHQSAYGPLEFPLERISAAWRSVFPPELLTSGDGCSDASERDRAEFETLLEDVWDSINANRALHEQFAVPAAASKGAAGGQSGSQGSGGSVATSSSSCLSSGETVMSHTLENWGFFTNRRLRAAMMGHDGTATMTSVHAAGNSASGSLPGRSSFSPPHDQCAVAYEFDEADSPSNIVMEEADADGGEGGPGGGPSRTIKCATLHKLIERVTHEKYVDLSTRYVFLLTYHSFTSARRLLALLAARFHVPLPAHLSAAELHNFRTNKLERVQIRVCSVIKNWIDEHWADFADDHELKAELQRLVQSISAAAGSALTAQLAKALAALIRKKERGTLTAPLGAGVGVGAGAAADGALTSGAFPSASGSGSAGSAAPPKLLISSRLTLESFDLAAVDELELARQLTLIDFAKFRAIRPRECLNQNWSRPLPVKSVLAPNILAMIAQFNQVSLWVAATIVRQKDLKARVRFYEKFIKIADHCRALNNFNSLFAIYCGLSSNPVHRLRRTKAAVHSKFQSKFSSFAELFRGDKNSRAFRRALQQAATPAIPHLGIFLSDLTFIEDGNPDLLAGMINFQKRAKLAERIRFIRQYQQEGYNLRPAPVVQEYFRRELAEEIDAEALWKISKEVEPREPGS